MNRIRASIMERMREKRRSRAVTSFIGIRKTANCRPHISIDFITLSLLWKDLQQGCPCMGKTVPSCVQPYFRLKPSMNLSLAYSAVMIGVLILDYRSRNLLSLMCRYCVFSSVLFPVAFQICRWYNSFARDSLTIIIWR